MMKRYAAAACVIVMSALLAGGCSSGNPNVQAVAPAPSDHLTGIAPESGSYNLYRAVGTDQNEPTLEKIWTVSLSRGERVGFRWEINKQDKWAPSGAGFHLIAYAGGQARDLGPLVNRDTKYVWAGTTGDVMGYFHKQAGFKPESI